jgi:hypothetical protein
MKQQEFLEIKAAQVAEQIKVRLARQQAARDAVIQAKVDDALAEEKAKVEAVDAKAAYFKYSYQQNVQHHTGTPPTIPTVLNVDGTVDYVATMRLIFPSQS